MTSGSYLAEFLHPSPHRTQVEGDPKEVVGNSSPRPSAPTTTTLFRTTTWHFQTKRPCIRTRTSDPSLGGETTGSGRSSEGSCDGKSAGLSALSAASSWKRSDQKGLTASGRKTTGGAVGLASAPSFGPAASIALGPPESGVFSDTSSLMAQGHNQNPKRKRLGLVTRAAKKA